jgi:phage tail-like protein
MAEYPLPKFHFQVDWGSNIKIGFTEVTGLEVTTEKIEYRDGASPEFTKIRMPGMQTYGDLTLKRGIFATNNEFYDWWNSVSLNTIQRRNITISLLNENHLPVVVWRVKNAWPTKVTSTDLNSSSQDVAIETLVLTHEGLTMEHR